MATAEVDLVISGGTLVSPEGSVQASVAVADGVIIAIGAEDRMPSARETIDAGGKHVVPGAIDSHVHFREPGYIHKEDWATGTAAAASGGVTTVFEMPNTNPPTSTADALAIKQEIAAASAHVDYGIYGLLGGGDNLDQLEPMAEAGITGYKCYIGSSTHDHLTPPDDGIILEGFEIIAQTGLRCAVHAENTGINDRRTRLLQEAQRIDPLAHQAARPVVGATEAVGRAIVFAEWTGCRLHIAHESSKDGLHLIRDAKARGVDVTAETCPQYLLLTSEDMKRQGGITRCNPPIREPGHDEGLWQGLRDGIIDMIATDHAPHLPEEKSHANIWHCACGFPGVETQMPLMLTQVNGGRMSINKYVEWASVNPAKAWSLYPRKGVLQVGSDADIVIVDLEREATIDREMLHSKSHVSPWHGVAVKGVPIATIVRGRVVMQGGELIGEPGWGRPVVQDIPAPAPSNVDQTSAAIVRRPEA